MKVSATRAAPTLDHTLNQQSATRLPSGHRASPRTPRLLLWCLLHWGAASGRAPGESDGHHVTIPVGIRTRGIRALSVRIEHRWSRLRTAALRRVVEVFWVRRRSTWPWLTLAALAILLGVSSQLRSPTVDEPFHLARGLAYWQTGSPRHSVDHPILLNLIGAIPAALTTDVSLESLPGWGQKTIHGVAFGYYQANYAAFVQQVFAGRLLIALVAVLFAGYVYRFAVETWGWRPGMLCLWLLVFNPACLGHGRLLMTDLRRHGRVAAPA